MNPALEITIHGLTFGGEGVGRLADGKAVFVPFTIPGEKVSINITEDKKKYARAELVEVLEPSASRIVPRCKHFGQCGGCQLQHMDYPTQLEQKRLIVMDQFRRAGLADQISVLPVMASPSEWNYRNTIQFHRTLDGRLGYQRSRSHEVIPIEECHLPLEAIDQAWKSLTLDPQLPLERVSIRAGADDDILMTLETGPESLPIVELDLPYSILHHSQAGNLVLAGSPFTQMVVDGQSFQVSANSFFQVNADVAAKMVEYVLEVAPGRRNRYADRPLLRGWTVQ